MFAGGSDLPRFNLASHLIRGITRDVTHVYVTRYHTMSRRGRPLAMEAEDWDCHSEAKFGVGISHLRLN